MNKAEFLQTKSFIYSDIRRELDLVKAGGSAGNFMLALALLCYTEFAGGLKRNIFKGGQSRRNFDSFFDDLGAGYVKFRGAVNVYDVFRCGLAHEYYVKRDCVVAIYTKRKTGLGFGSKKNRYYFAVDRYFRDFKRAFDALGKRLYP